MARETERSVRAGIVAVFFVGLRHRNPGAAVNAVVALVVTALPGLVERRYDVTFRPWQRIYANVAMLMHTVGMLGPYDDVWWWDHLTHTYSATLLGGLVHTVARRRDRDPAPHVLGWVVGAGLLWELMEYVIHAVSRRVGLEPLLVSYGPEDTLFDLVFDLVGAVVVLVLGDSLLGNLLPEEHERQRDREAGPE